MNKINQVYPVNEEILEELVSQAVPIHPVVGASFFKPWETTVYLVCKGDMIVYVGKTRQAIGARLRQHRSDGTLLGEQMDIAANRLTIAVVDSQDKSIPLRKTDDLEEYLIKALRPEFNFNGIAESELTGKAKERRQQTRERRKIEGEKQHEEAQKYREFKGRVKGEINGWWALTQAKIDLCVGKYAQDHLQGLEVDTEKVKLEIIAIALQECKMLEERINNPDFQLNTEGLSVSDFIIF